MSAFTGGRNHGGEVRLGDAIMFEPLADVIPRLINRLSHIRVFRAKQTAYVLNVLHSSLIHRINNPVKSRITLPVTGQLIQLNMLGMAKPGRRVGTPLEYRIAFAARVKAARERVDLSQAQVASELTRIVGRPVSPDTYRKWENVSPDGEGALLPHDLLMAFCDITRIHVFELLAPTLPFPKAHAAVERKHRKAG